MEKANITREVDPARTDGARVVVLGANAWLVLCVLPMLLAEPRSFLSLAWLALPLPALAAGAALLARHQLVAGFLLLGGFPTLLSALVAVLSRLVVQTPFSTIGLLIGALSLIAYGAGAVFAVQRPQALRPTHRRPLGSVAPIDEPRSRTLLRRSMLAVGGAGAIAIGVIAPTFGGAESYRAEWGEAAAEASILVAVVGGALGVVTIALFLGPTLRAQRTPMPTKRQTRRRVIALLMSVAIGVAFWAFYLLQG